MSKNIEIIDIEDDYYDYSNFAKLDKEKIMSIMKNKIKHIINMQEF